MLPLRLRFTPVPLKARHDGWTAARQIRFIEELAATRSLTGACKAVGMSRASAYKLRGHADAADFRAAWDKALQADFTAERRRSPRALQRLRRLEKKRKFDEVHETHGPPDSPAGTPSLSSALATLETYVRLLRSQNDGLGSARGV
jgi:hypothetical protein